MTRHPSFVCWLVFAVAGGGCQTTPTFPTAVSGPEVLVTTMPGPTAGTFDVTLNVDSSCAVVPPADRTRRYTATIAPAGRQSIVTLSGSTFLAGEVCTRSREGLGCHQFRASEDFDWMGIDLRPEAEARGGHIVERLESGGWLDISGIGGGSVHDWNDFVLTLDGRVSYCPSGSDFPSDVCVGPRGSGETDTSRLCEAPRSQLRFVRR